MRKCLKCGLEYSDDSQICRACGAILDEGDALAETTPFEPAAQSPWLPDDDENPIAARAPGDWICPRCDARVPANFDVCWNCRAATSPPEKPAAPAAAPDYPRRQCSACGSTRVIPGASIADTGQYSQGTLAVIVDADPHALIFKNRLRGDLLADVCGDCGHVELRVHNHVELYKHYRSSELP
jgi:hypothetical protein